MTTLKLVQPEKPEYFDAARALRNIADEIENGAYGDVQSCGVVVLGDTLEVFGAGENSGGPMINLLFSAAVARFARDLEDGIV